MGFSVQTIAAGYNSEIINYSPFSPTVIREEGAGIKVKFAQAYIIDYGQNGKRIKIDGMEAEYSSNGSIWLNITASKPTTTGIQMVGNDEENLTPKGDLIPSKVQSAELSTSQDSSPASETTVKYSLKVADLDSDGIKEMYICENIHWFLTFFGHE